MERVSEHLSELVSNGFIERDDDTELTRLLGWWGHNTIENANVAKAAIKTLESLPRCAVLSNAIKALDKLANKFIDPLVKPLRNELLNGYPNPILPEPILSLTGAEPTPAGSVPKTEGVSTGEIGDRKGYAFQGKIIRLTHHDFAQWQSSFHTIPDLYAELQAIDDRLSDDPPEGFNPKKWYGTVSAWLRNKHEKRTAQASPPQPLEGDVPYYESDPQLGQARAQVVLFLEHGVWYGYGPPPNHPNTLVAHKILDEFRDPLAKLPAPEVV
jgi:hypothetical protein